MDQIHGLGAGVSMATSGAHAVRGGNWRIFKEMLDESMAQVYLNTTVSPVSPLYRVSELRVR
jgi:prenylcysteine oxidase/farnesylcysteine lyase